MKMIKGSRRLVVISLIVLAVLLISLSWALADTSPPLAEWISIIGTTGLDEGKSVQVTSDGGYIIAGSTESFGAGERDVYLVKTDSMGAEEWNRTFGASDDDGGNSVQVTSDGGYIITGYTNSSGAGYDVYLVKTDSMGLEEWSRTFGGSENDYGESVQEASDGGYIITGYTESFGAGEADVYLVKTDSTGVEEWSRTFGGAYNDYGSSVQVTSDGGYIITGYTRSFGARYYDDVYLVKTDSLGVEEWSRTFGGSDYNYGSSVQVTSDGGYIITGYTGPYNDNDVYLVKTDSLGVEEWSRTFGGSNDDYGHSVQEASDGGYIIVGETYSFGAGGYDVYLVKTDSMGLEEWSRAFGGSNSDSGYSVQVTSDGGYIITGSTESFGAGDWDVYLVKTDSHGLVDGNAREEWSSFIGTQGHDEGRSVQVTSDGGYIITGYTNDDYWGQGVYLVKIDSLGVNEWTRTFSAGEHGYSVQETSDGGYIIAGETRYHSAGGHDVYLLKTDSMGLEEWSRTIGGSEDDYGYSVQVTSDGGYIITGYTYSLWNLYDVYLVKTDSLGVEEWSRTFGDRNSNYGHSVQVTSDGGYIITGYTGPYNDNDVYLVKTDPMGVEEWSRTFGGSENDYGHSVQEASDGGYIIVGETYSFGAGESDVYLVKTDSMGVEEWSRTFGGSDEDIGYSVQVTSDGGYIITGWTESFSDDDLDVESIVGDVYVVKIVGDVYLVKTDSMGLEEWHRTFGDSNKDVGYSVQVTSDGGYIIGGLAYATTWSGCNVYLVKVGPQGDPHSPEPTPSPSPSPEPTAEPEQKGIPGFPILAIVIGLFLSLLILKKIQS